MRRVREFAGVLLASSVLIAARAVPTPAPEPKPAPATKAAQAPVDSMGPTGLPVSPATATGLPSGPVETLQDALISAYRDNPNLKAQRARLRALDETVPQATAGWKPTVVLNGTWGETLAKQNIVNLPNTLRIEDHPLNGTARVTQPLFRGGQTFFRTLQAKANVAAGRAQLAASEEQTLFNTVTSYFNVVRDAATVQLSKNNVEVLKRELEAANDRFEVGEITRTDVAQSQARLSLGQTTLTGAEAQLVASRTGYASIVGHLPGNLDTRPPIPGLPLSEASAQDLAAAHNPTLIAAKETEHASSAATSVAWGALLPQVSVVGEADFSQTRQFFSGLPIQVKDRQRAILLQATVPIYQAGAEYAGIRQAKQIDSQNRLLVSQAARDLQEQVSNAWEALRSARASIVSNQEQVNANQIAYEGVKQEAEVGSRTTLDVLNAEQELLNSQVSLVGSQRDEYVASYNLLASVGALTAQDLKLPVKIYDAKANQRSLIFKQFWPGTQTHD